MKKKYKLHDLDIRRVDLVDRGAAQEAHIVLAKSDTGLADRLDTFLKAQAPTQPYGKKPAPGKPVAKPPAKAPAKLAAKKPSAKKPAKPAIDPTKPGIALRPEPPASAAPVASGGEEGSSRLVRLSPADFEVVRSDANMMEWAIPPDALPEGVEEAVMTMVRAGQESRFQWMVDPIAGPPVEGNAKTAAEAFMAMRAALTTQGSLNPMDMLGGFPGAEPGAPNPVLARSPNPAMQPKPKPPVAKADPVASALADERKRRKKKASPPKAQEQPVSEDEEEEPEKKPEEKPANVGYSKRTPGIARALRALARAKKNNKRRMAEGKKPIVGGKQVSPSSLSKAETEEAVLGTLELVTKGLIEVGVFAHDATGEDLRDILPPNLLDEISDKLSATESAE